MICWLAEDGGELLPAMNSVSTFKFAIPLLTICLLEVRLNDPAPSKVQFEPMVRSPLRVNERSFSRSVGELTPAIVRLPSSIVDFKVSTLEAGVSSLPT